MTATQRLASALLLVELLSLRAVADDAPKPPPPSPNLSLPAERFVFEGQPAFILFPDNCRRSVPQAWIWYAPTLPGLPDRLEEWMHERFLEAGVAVVGIDVGDSFSSPPARAAYTAFHKELTENRNFAPRPCLLGRSRGGLMMTGWAVEHAESVAGIAGIYPVLDFRSYPGLEITARAYGMSPQELDAKAADHNPMLRLASLAKAKVPAFFIHGDVDKVVPLEANSAEFARRYEEAGAGKLVTVQVPKGQGHNGWEGFFRCQELIDFAIARAREGAVVVEN